MPSPATSLPFTPSRQPADKRQQNAPLPCYRTVASLAQHAKMLASIALSESQREDLPRLNSTQLDRYDSMRESLRECLNSSQMIQTHAQFLDATLHPAGHSHPDRLNTEITPPTPGEIMVVRGGLATYLLGATPGEPLGDQAGNFGRVLATLPATSPHASGDALLWSHAAETRQALADLLDSLTDSQIGARYPAVNAAMHRAAGVLEKTAATVAEGK